jgi:hypothetical protein
MSNAEAEPTHAKTFCAYNRIFVEFEQGKRVWGALMLDYQGLPIPCSEHDLEETDNNIKGII